MCEVCVFSILSWDPRSCGSGISIHCHPVSGGGTAGAARREDVRFCMFPQVQERNQAEAGRTNRLISSSRSRRIRGYR